MVIYKIEDITKASVGDLMSAWNFHKNGIWQKSIETNREIIREMRGISKKIGMKMRKKLKMVAMIIHLNGLNLSVEMV